MNDTTTVTGTMTDQERQDVAVAMVKAQAPPKELYAALAKANLAFKPVVKDRTVVVTKSAEKGGGFAYEFRYASLPALLDAVRDALSNNGLILIQRIITPSGATQQYVETRLAHVSGESIFNLTQMIPTESGQVGYAKAQSYARRYGIQLLLCLAGEDDDDAQQPGERAEARDINRPGMVDGDPVPVSGKSSPIPPDPEYVDEYSRRILAAFDNQDPVGAFSLFDELTAEEQTMLWRRGGLTHNQKQMIRDKGVVKNKPAPRGRRA